MAKGVDYIHHQIRNVVMRHPFEGALILAMGSDNNVRILQKYLECYSLRIQAILDNDPRKWGKWSGRLKVFKPEEILIPFKKKALIFIFSPKYADQMKQQLESMGYKENVQFFVVKDFRQPKDNWFMFCSKLAEAVKGMMIRKKILQKYGNNIRIFIVRGATGDVFFNGLYIDAYTRRCGIGKYVLAGDAKGLSQIAKLFGIANTVSLSYKEAESLQQCYKFFRCTDVEDLFMWQNSLYFNRCQTRMHREFNFLDTYTYYIYKGIVDRSEWKSPEFKTLSQTLVKKYKKLGLIKGKTVIIAPFAYSVRNLPVWFWETIAEKLKEKGYVVFANINTETEINIFENMETVFVPFDECEAILKYAGYFLALRSGLCDIVSMIPCKQVILYPAEMDPIDYRVHRSDMVFSGFKTMGYDMKNIIEISSPMIHDIVCPFNQELTGEKAWVYYQKLIEKVMEQF